MLRVIFDVATVTFFSGTFIVFFDALVVVTVGRFVVLGLNVVVVITFVVLFGVVVVVIAFVVFALAGAFVVVFCFFFGVVFGDGFLVVLLFVVFVVVLGLTVVCENTGLFFVLLVYAPFYSSSFDLPMPNHKGKKSLFH